MADEPSTSRKAVKTYVPSYQKDIWQTHAEDLGMSQSEFVRTMVQAGRRYFGGAEERGTQEAHSNSPDSDQKDESDLKDRVHQQLSSADALTWDELLTLVTDDVETRLENALDDLQEDNVVKYSGRKNGYILIES